MSREVPMDRPATLSELVGVSEDLRRLEHRVDSIENVQQAGERRAAEWVGTNGGGRLGRMESDVMALGKRADGSDSRIGALEAWRTATVARLGVFMGLGGAAAGILAALAVKLVEHLFK